MKKMIVSILVLSSVSIFAQDLYNQVESKSNFNATSEKFKEIAIDGLVQVKKLNIKNLEKDLNKEIEKKEITEENKIQ